MTDRRHHDRSRLHALADALQTHLSADRAPFDVAFARCQWDLIRELTATLAIARQLAVRGPGHGRHVALYRLGDVLDGLMRDHVRNLGFVQLEEEWAEHCRHTGTLLHRLRAALADDDALVTATAAPHGTADRARSSRPAAISV